MSVSSLSKQYPKGSIYWYIYPHLVDLFYGKCIVNTIPAPSACAKFTSVSLKTEIVVGSVKFHPFH